MKRKGLRRRYRGEFTRQNISRLFSPFETPTEKRLCAMATLRGVENPAIVLRREPGQTRKGVNLSYRHDAAKPIHPFNYPLICDVFRR